MATKTTELKHRIFGLGFYLAQSPSPGDPAGLYRMILTINLGLWYWRKTWYRGIGVGPGNNMWPQTQGGENANS